MKNIFLFPTNSKPQHIYITSDEEIKEGNWVFDSTNYGLIHKVWEVTEKHFSFKDSLHARGLKSTNRNLKCHFKKIILTTDPDLIADGVQAIDYEFLQWFVNNPNCERVDFFKLEYSEYSNSKCLKCGFIENHDKVDTEDCPKCSNTTYEHFYNQYKLIIPKEKTIEEAAERMLPDFKLTQDVFDFVFKINTPTSEPKQETLEEAAERLTEGVYQNDTWEEGRLKRQGYYQGIIDGAKWQAERMYSEEEVLNIIKESRYSEFAIDDLGLWFEQFKKK